MTASISDILKFVSHIIYYIWNKFVYFIIEISELLPKICSIFMSLSLLKNKELQYVYNFEFEYNYMCFILDMYDFFQK